MATANEHGMEWMNAYVPSALKKWVRLQAAAAEQSMSEWLRELIEKEQARHERRK